MVVAHEPLFFSHFSELCACCLRARVLLCCAISCSRLSCAIRERPGSDRFAKVDLRRPGCLCSSQSRRRRRRSTVPLELSVTERGIFEMDSTADSSGYDSLGSQQSLIQSSEDEIDEKRISGEVFDSLRRARGHREGSTAGGRGARRRGRGGRRRGRDEGEEGKRGSCAAHRPALTEIEPRQKSHAACWFGPKCGIVVVGTTTGAAFE